MCVCADAYELQQMPMLRGGRRECSHHHLNIQTRSQYFNRGVTTDLRLYLQLFLGDVHVKRFRVDVDADGVAITA